MWCRYQCYECFPQPGLGGLRRCNTAESFVGVDLRATAAEANCLKFSFAHRDSGFKMYLGYFAGLFVVRICTQNSFAICLFSPRDNRRIPKQMQIPGLNLLSGSPNITPSNGTALPEEVRLSSVPLTGGEISVSAATRSPSNPIDDPPCEHSTFALNTVTEDTKEPSNQRQIDGTDSELVLPDPLDLALEESSDHSAESIQGEENESDSEGRYGFFDSLDLLIVRRPKVMRMLRKY
jgi:hypothetical protein